MKSFVDAHCDTIVKLCGRGEELLEAPCMQLDLKRLEAFPRAVQFFAVWLDPVYYPIAMRQTMKYIAFYYKQLEKNAESIRHINTFADIIRNKAEHLEYLRGKRFQVRELPFSLEEVSL